MTLFSKILVAVDGSKPSEKAFDAALELVKSCLITAEIMLVHVVPTPIPQDGADSSALENIDEKNGWSLLERYNNRAKEKYGIQVKKILAGGDAGHKILQTAYENNVDLIVVGHRGFGRLKELLMGSVAHHVANNSKVSVMIIR
jgi:nucleotide-binding universal stress UspA family protein